jgi:hypothetical protein
VIGVGDRVPDARVWMSADDRKGALLSDLAQQGPFLVLFYLYDWTST